MIPAIITRRDGVEELMRCVPIGSHAADVVASEIAIACQRAYELGRKDELAAVESDIMGTLHRLSSDQDYFETEAEENAEDASAWT